MLKNYLKIAWRNMFRNRLFTIINTVGLSFSVAFCLLLFFYIRNEQSYDSFPTKKDRLFRLEKTNMWVSAPVKPKPGFLSFLSASDETANDIEFPLIVGPDLQNAFPEIASVTRFQNLSNHFGGELIRVRDEVFRENDVYYADQNFFNTFSLPFISGNPSTALGAAGRVVLSETAVKKYFGRDNPIGKTVALVNDSNRLLTVTGVAKDPPSNSSIQFAMVVSLQTDPDYEENLKQRFNQNSHLFFVELKEGVDADRFGHKLNAWVKTYFKEYIAFFKGADMSKFSWYLRPLTACHYNPAPEWGHYTNAKNIYQLVCLVIVILLIASLNYVLITISNAASRAQEIGLRKVMGAKRRTVVFQIWLETQLIVLIAVILGLILTWSFLPLFNSILNAHLAYSQIPLTEVLFGSLVLSLLLSLLAGYYPALLISGLRPLSVIKSFQTFKINPRFSQAMVIFQYTGCVVLMLAAFVINRQMSYINNKDLGFDKDQVLIVSNQSHDPSGSRLLYDRLRDYSKSKPFISYFSGMNGGLDGSANTYGSVQNGMQQWRHSYTVDYDFFKMLGLKLLMGRTFSREIASDTSRAVHPLVVNETLFNELGKEARLGEFCKPIEGTIIGVVKDYHFDALSKRIEPEEHRLARREYLGSFMFKVRAGMMQTAIEDLQKEWKLATNNLPFQYTFLDQSIAKMYDADTRWQKTVQFSCLFAIVIACMGLFGLSAINASNRTKEVGIRKVLGANLGDIVSTLSSGFFIMVVISITIAAPLAWWLMNGWLQTFAYRIDLSWWMFLVVAVAAISIAIGAVSFHAIRTAQINPVKSLRMD
ncbi:MAG TPA: ABC transporter permease [Puia sp.]|nr:ABC transporter permease [Puia sp.]